MTTVACKLGKRLQSCPVPFNLSTQPHCNVTLWTLIFALELPLPPFNSNLNLLSSNLQGCRRFPLALHLCSANPISAFKAHHSLFVLSFPNYLESSFALSTVVGGGHWKKVLYSNHPLVFGCCIENKPFLLSYFRSCYKPGTIPC